METVCIFSSDDESEVISIRGILEQNGIPTMVKNLYTQNLFTWTKMFSGHDAIAGSIQVFVREDDLDRGLELLQGEVQAPADPGSADPGGAAGEAGNGSSSPR